MIRSRSIRAATLGAVLVMAVLVAPGAGAAEPTPRESYVERAEPICRTNVLANKQIFKGAKAEVKAGELKKASKHFLRAATAFGKTIRQLAAIPRPPEDAAKLWKWLNLLRKEKTIVEKIGRALAAEQKRKAESFSVELNRNSNQANNAVLAFGFDYCRIDPSRFG
jgi:hypothetical protein